eukprot:CAMPEP_0185027788 /NCGR_PEP_ID=MMETSP1103-20130426/13015_1 /TAXON_ID=36769 /ORGANISM="Paraphysomonas bandaiensis, Strain Caron Lab Isolate" /LENGTH=638 /DNA_ID=CAMNT_0027561919 /DNA_START=21 /DNA_END=1937 /DNA_ORIENTATION=+
MVFPSGGSAGLIVLICMLVVLLSGHARAGECVCSDMSSQRRALGSRRSIKFSDAVVRGVDYKRLATKRHRRHIAKSETENNNCEAEQVHISPGNSIDSMFVSYTSNSFKSEVYYSHREADVLNDAHSQLTATGTHRAYAEQYYIIGNLVDPGMGEPIQTSEYIRELEDTTAWAYDKDTGERWANWYNVTEMFYKFGQYNNPYMVYQSPLVHAVELTGLSSGVTYYYRVADSCTVFQFTMPRFTLSDTSKSQESLFPFSFGMIGDIGLTNVSMMTFSALEALESDAVLIVGDLSYSDGWMNTWDSFGRAIQSLGSQTPLMTTGGNHELQSGENWVSYQLRYLTPYSGSGSPDPVYWGREMGPVHVIALNSYAAYSNTSIQYRWLENYLSTHVNRDRTPWVVVMMHTPLYHSNTVHWKEGELMRLAMEPLLYAYGVDVVLSGHLHAYERTEPVYDNSLDPCGMTHLILGDGGNYEGEATPWRIENTSTGAPVWSSFRESSFGVGSIVIVNSTHAQFSWHRHACGSSSSDAYYMNFSDSCFSPEDNSEHAMETSDSTWIVRPDSITCPNRHTTTGYTPTSSTSSGNDDDSDGLSSTAVALIAVCCILGILCLTLAGVIVYLYKKIRVKGSSDGTDLLQVKS